MKALTLYQPWATLIAIGEGQRLLYYDSENELTELLHKDGKFVGFAPA